MKNKFFIGIDVGGTKISAGLVTDSGKILSREKHPTPKKAKHKKIFSVILKLIKNILGEKNLTSKDLEAIGIGIPGIVDTEKGQILTTPNINLAGFDIVKKIRKRFKVKVFIGNDVNLGTLGEKWLGAARNAKNVIGIFPGTGVGGGIIINGKLLTGTSGAAAEIGHIIIDVNGPKCTCGNRGCIEAVAGRWAIERDIRNAVKDGEKTLITKLLGKNPKTIKSKVLKKALKKKDALVTDIIKHASKNLGKVCITLRHILDPEAIVFGGGLVEACGKFILPIIKKTLDKDPFFSRIPECKIVESRLGDDAVILGAVALARQYLGRDISASSLKDLYPEIHYTADGVIINGISYNKNVFIRADGKIKTKKAFGTVHKIDPDELKKICKKKPQVLIIGSEKNTSLRLTKQAKKSLKRKGIICKLFPVKEAIRFYNKTNLRKAIFLQVTK
ncbi:MAG: ROK family protein [Elusimicrobia bacterium]|nr:ROK family protein [Elusimicrobiota bacterium]